MKVQQCVNSGFCCKQSPCTYGKWNKDKTACEYLEYVDELTTKCGKYDEISKDPGSKYYPAFGAGCCSALFNQDRDKIINERYDGKIPFIEIDDW